VRRLTMGLALAALTALPATLTAQEAPGRDAAADLRAMATQPSAAERDRALVRGFLESDRVRRVAEDRGMDVRALEEGVAALDDAATADLAERIRSTQDTAAHVGGDTFVISSTVVIIALLVIILIVVS